MSKINLLNEISLEFGSLDNPQSHLIKKNKIKEWMLSSDIEALAALSYFILNKFYYKRIEPSLTLEDYKKFLLFYWERCLKENLESGEWSDSRYEAGWSIVNWFISLWNDKSVPKEILSEIKEWIASIYRDADDELKLCIETAILEHLFQNKKIKSFFKNWKKDEILNEAYKNALFYCD
jgi:hypothetical protein